MAIAICDSMTTTTLITLRHSCAGWSADFTKHPYGQTVYDAFLDRTLPFTAEASAADVLRDQARRFPDATFIVEEA